MTSTTVLATRFEARVTGNVLADIVMVEIGLYQEVYVPMTIMGGPVGTYKTEWRTVYTRPATTKEIEAAIDGLFIDIFEEEVLGL